MNGRVRKRVKDDFYNEIKPHLHRRIGRELRLARRVLDLGCGACDLVEYLADTYCQEVTGIDVSSGSFPSGRRAGRGSRFRCLKRDAARLGFIAEGSMDAVVTMWALHEMKRPKVILKEAHRVLRRGGEILVVDFPKGSFAQELWNEDYYCPEEVKTLLKDAGFESVTVRLIEREQVMWARGHRPPSARDDRPDLGTQERTGLEAQR